MTRSTKTPQSITAIVRLLNKTARVMQMISMRLDVMDFGQRQLTHRLYRLERAAAKGSQKPGKKR